MQGHTSISLLKTWITEKHHKLLSIAFSSVQQAPQLKMAYSICFSYKPSILVPHAPQMYFPEALHIFYQLPSMKFGAKAQGLDSGMVSCGRRGPQFQRNQDSLCNSKYLFPNNTKQVKVRKNIRMPSTAQPYATSSQGVFSNSQSFHKSHSHTGNSPESASPRWIGHWTLLCFYFPHTVLSLIRRNLHKV